MTKVTNDIITSTLYSMASLKNELLDFLPNFFHGVVIILVGVLIAYLLKWSASLLVRWGLRLLPKALTRKGLIKDNFSEVVIGTGRILFFLTLYLSLTTGFKKMGLLIVSEWFERLGRYFPNILGAFIILFIGWKLKDLIAELVFNTLNKADFLYSKVVSETFSWSIFLISLLIALEQLGINISLVLNVVTVLLAVVCSGVALTVALGSKHTISDIIYCYQLHRHIKVGQAVKIEDISGVVKSIGPTFVTMETTGGEVIIPGSLFHSKVAFVIDKEVGL